MIAVYHSWGLDGHALLGARCSGQLGHGQWVDLSLPLFIFLIKLVVKNMSITNHPCALCRCLLHLNGHPRLVLRDEPHSWCALWRVLKGHLRSYHLFFQPSTLTKDKLVRSENDWVWLMFMKYYIIVNNSCQSKKKDHLLNIYKPFQDRISHHISDVEPLQEREKSQSRGDFQKMRAKQQMDEDLQGYQVL